MPLLARKTFVPNQLPADISPDVEVFTVAETKEAFTSYEGFLARYEQLRQPVWSCSVTGKISMTYEQAIKSEQAASKQLQGFPEPFRRPALLFVHHCNSSLEPILDDVYEELHTRFAVGEAVEASVEAGGKQIDAVILEIHEPPSTPPKSADTSMEQGSVAASAARNGDAPLLADPLLSPPAVVVNGSAAPKVDSAGGETPMDMVAGAASVPAAGREKENESEDDDEEEASPTYSVQFSDGAGTIRRDVDSDDITRLKRAPTRDTIRTFIKGCARRVRWKDSNVWVVKDELMQELDLPCKFPELTYAVVTSAMSPVKRRRSSVVSPGEKRSKRSKTPKAPMKQMTLLDMVAAATPAAKPQAIAKLSKPPPASAKARSSLGGFELEPATPPATAKAGKKTSMPSTPKTPDGKPSKAVAKPRSRPSKAEQAAIAAAKAEAAAAAAKTVAMSKTNKMIVDRVKNLDTAQAQPKGYVARVLTQAARTLSTPERNTLPPEQRKLVEEKIAQRLKMEALKKLTPEERKAKYDEQRKKKSAERRQVKIQQRLIEKESNRVYDDDDVAHPKSLPNLDTVTLPSGLRNDSFGDLAMVVEFLHVFQHVLAPQSTAAAIDAGSLAQALVSGSSGMDVLSSVLTSLLKIVSADQGNRKELGIKVSSMPLMAETAAELTRLILLPSHLLASATVATTTATTTTLTTAAIPTKSSSVSPSRERSPAAKPTEETEESEDTTTATTEEEAMDAEEATTATSAERKQDGETEETTLEDEDFEDEDLSPQLVEILLRMTTMDFQDLPPNDKLQLLVALCGRVLSTTAIQDYQLERRDAMKQLWRNRIEEGKEKKEKEEKEKQEKQAKKDQQLKKQQQMMQDAMDSFKVFKSEKGQSATSPGGGAALQATTSEAESTDPSNKDVKDVKEEDKSVQRRPATERQMERERQLAKDKERRDREAKEMQVQRDAEQKEQRQHKFLNDIENCKRAFRLMPLGFDRFRRRCWSFNPSVLPGLFLEDEWSPDTPEVRTHGETTPQTSTVSGVMTPSPNVSQNSAVVGESPAVAVAATTPVAMDTSEAKPAPLNETGGCRWRVFQTVAQFDEYVESLTLTGVREKALKEAFEKQRSTLVSAIKKYSGNFTDTNGEQDSGADGSTGSLNVNKLRESYKEDLVEITQRLYRGGLGDPGDLEMFQAKVASTEKMADMGALLLDVYRMINPRFTQGILCPADVQETQLAIARAEGKEKGFKRTPCRLAEWKVAVTAAATLSRLHLLQAILDECIQWHKSAENARCKICRKKSDDVHMLLCDDCNQGFHIYCLRPALSKIPSGHWACPSCQPLNARRSIRDVSYNENENSEEEAEEEEEEEEEEADSDDSGSEESGEDAAAAAEDGERTESDTNDDSCSTCGAAGELLCCDTCPRVFHLECHVPPLRRPPRGKFICCLCKNPRLAVGRSRSQSKKSQQSQGSRSRSASRSKRSPAGRRGSRRQVQEVEESEAEEEEEEEESTAAEESQQASEEEEEAEEEVVVEEEPHPQRGSGRGRRAVIKSSSEDESGDGNSESENGIEEASDNTDTEARQPARRTASLNAGRSTKRTAVSSKGAKTKRSASALSSRAPPAKRRVRQLSDSEDDRSSMTASRRGGRDSHNLKGIAGIINSVIAHDEAEPFALPVSLKDVPDYLEVVDEPMDFGTIRSRLKNMYYCETETVLKDVALVFKNCDVYNHPSTNTYKRGVKVERYFCRLLKTQLKGYFSRYTSVLI